MGADQGDDDDDDVDRFYRCLSMSRDVDRRRYMSLCEVCTEAVHSVANLNTGYITALGMCEVCTEAVHSVAL